MDLLNFQDTDFINKEGINYININKIDERIIITNTENYFKSTIYKNLCKYSRLSKIKIENITYIPELFINSYASWYSSLYYINLENSKRIREKDKENENETKNTNELLTDILKSVIVIKTDLANIQSFVSNPNPNSKINLMNYTNPIKNKIHEIKRQTQPIQEKIEEIKDDIFEELKTKNN